MDQPDFNSGKSPRRELQGPRPTPLKVRKDSHKIRKPPVAPQQQPSQPPQPYHHHHHHHHHQTQPRPPVIIYTVSPKVIHTDPSEFMTLVQRLTGSSSTTTCSTSSITSSSSYFSDHANGAISPAARFASTEKTKSPEKKKQQHQQQQEESSDMGMIEGVERTGFFPGILSPGPAALPPIPANFFSPPSDPNPMSFLYDFSPVLQGNNKNYLEGSSSFMMPSPSFFLSPHITSPTTPSLDIFNNFFDFQF